MILGIKPSNPDIGFGYIKKSGKKGKSGGKSGWKKWKKWVAAVVTGEYRA